MIIKNKAIFLTIIFCVIFFITTFYSGKKSTLNAKEGAVVSLGDKSYVKKNNIDVIYLAGGCFWGIEKLMDAVPGVVAATSGYANGDSKIVPTYESVCAGATGYKEAVRVEYDKKSISLESILSTFFTVIDPTVRNRQGNDRGSQYQSGIYYIDSASEEIVKRIIETEKIRHKNFSVEVEPLVNFYDAEEYHQNYLKKNPRGYCHISNEKIEKASKINIEPAKYRRPSENEIIKMLTELQYNVTQNSATEAPFDNEFLKNKERGIYVDIVTGEPLFSSSNKYDGSCGWPSFTKPIDEKSVVNIKDYSHGMVRTEVKSRVGNSHLGHVFHGDSESPNGTRFCINSASLRFIPYDEMEKEGYEKLKQFVK